MIRTYTGEGEIDLGYEAPDKENFLDEMEKLDRAKGFPLTVRNESEGIIQMGAKDHHKKGPTRKKKKNKGKTTKYQRVQATINALNKVRVKKKTEEKDD